MRSSLRNKSIAFLIVFTLLFSFNLVSPVSGELIKSNDDGVAYDDFEDELSITKTNCSLAPGNESVILEYGPVPFIYDHKQKPGNIKAYFDDKGYITPGGDFAQLLSLLVNPDILPKEEYSNLARINENDDSIYLETESEVSRVLSYTYYPIHLFEFDIEQKLNRINNFTIDWYPGPYEEDANIDEVRLYMWSYGDIIPRWNYIDKMEYNEDNINNYSVFSREKSSTFISNQGKAFILVVGIPDENTGTYPAILSTDYIKLELSVKEGYKPNGNIISDLITPSSSKFNGWESVIWESSKYSEDSYVKLQILDQSNNVIESLEGNKEGFTSSPIDLSSLGTSYSSIKLKATLISNNFDVTPRIYKWVVLWQTTDGFLDKFNYDFRIGENYGVEIELGSVSVSEFYSEWPIFGKDSTNKRSYIGREVDYKGNKTYWRTFIDDDIAGWFKSPVMKDGIVYVGSNDKKIYAFELALDSSNDDSKYQAIDVSSPDYEVESSVALSDNYVIFGTSTQNSNENMVYALNKSDLSEKVWEYSLGDTNTLCYSSAPTISNGKVFLSSWSGKYGDIPQISYIFEKINRLIGYKLLNNKLIVLDETNGNEILEPIDLPAASLSSPAVDNGIIFVGCDNIEGASAYAFDEHSGRELWNASIGAVGRAAPVVTDGDNGKIVIFLTREQDLFSYRGLDKVVALNAEDGTLLWNYTIGNNSVILRNGILSLYNFSNIKATSQPAATPAVFEDSLYVLAPNGILYAFDIDTGEIIWSFEDAMSNSYHTASPVVVDDRVYTFSQNSHLYTLSTSNGQILNDYEITYEGYSGFLAYLYASPIVTDGLIVVSILEWLLTGEFYGHLMCYGEHKKNNIGKIYSIPIHVQSHKWWNKFNAVYSNTTENTISFSIIDREGNILKSGLNGSNNKITDIEKNEIILCAELNIGNSSQADPSLDSWSITWADEDEVPVFDESSFMAGEGQGGWVNVDIPECSIKVTDYGTNDIISGIDVDSAKFVLNYITSSDKTKTETFNADCIGSSGDQTVKIVANILELDLSIKELKNITFKIKDLAGNSAVDFKSSFKMDSGKPSSEIKNLDDFENTYNSAVTISADGEDGESGIASISLYYRLTSSDDWILFSKTESSYDWLFENDTSGNYEFTTIAQDNAGNKESLAENGEISFIFDNNDPFEPELKDKYSFNMLAEFSDENKISFEDDYELKDVEYRFNFNDLSDWNKINEDSIESKTYTPEWTINEDDWSQMNEDEEYFIYFRITDICGNQYITESNSKALKIIKDMSPPVIDVDISTPGFEDGGFTDSFTLKASIPEDIDAEYVILKYQYSENNEDWTAWKQYGQRINVSTADSFEWFIKADEGSGYYKFRTVIYDPAGNFVESNDKIVNLTLFPTSLLIVLTILVVISLIITILVLKNTKKKNKQ